jgi:acyl CoA:acetate/3-ketoacid CoA transferase alpha subunit
MKHYKARTLFIGSVIGKTGMYVAIPEKGFKGSKIEVEFKGQKMIIENWLKADAYRRFPDKWGRGTYTLGYFEWNPKL